MAGEVAGIDPSSQMIFFSVDQVRVRAAVRRSSPASPLERLWRMSGSSGDGVSEASSREAAKQSCN